MDTETATRTRLFFLCKVDLGQNSTATEGFFFMPFK